MIKKRFNFGSPDYRQGAHYSIIDNETNREMLSQNEIMDKLNELAYEKYILEKENEQLKNTNAMTEKRFTLTATGNYIYDNQDNGICPTLECIVTLLNELHEENHKIKTILLKKVEELNEDYNKSARAGMPTSIIIGELDSFEEICRNMEWIE